MPAHPPNLLSHSGEWTRPLDPGRLGLVLDFDGTISELVPVPGDAVLHPDVTPLLRSLASKLALTSIMSGRPAEDIRNRVDIDHLLYIGNHGVEHLSDGRLTLVPLATELPMSPEELMGRLKPIGDGPGVVWEPKQYSLAIHFRMSPNKPEAFLALLKAVDNVQEIQEMDMISGNMVLEIRAKNAVNKGSAIEKIVEERDLRTLIFLGDDTTDVDGLKALRRLTGDGAISGIGVAVIQKGTPQSVFDNADYSLDGVVEVVEFLKMLDRVTT